MAPPPIKPSPAPPGTPPGAPPRRDTREIVLAEEKKSRTTAWLSAAITSGVGALFTLIGVVGLVLGGAWVVIDKSEAAGTKAAKALKEELAEHKTEEREWRNTTELRAYDTQKDLREVYRVMPRREKSDRLEAEPTPLRVLDGGK